MSSYIQMYMSSDEDDDVLETETRPVDLSANDPACHVIFDGPDESEDSSSSSTDSSVRARAYQIEMFEASMKKNLIVVVSLVSDTTIVRAIT